jgi:glyoxylate reductase
VAAKQKPKVYITRKLPDPVEQRMLELFDVEINITDQPRSRPELLAAIKNVDVLVPTVSDIIDADLINQAGPSLKLITNFGNGVDNIDIKAARAKGIIVTNTANVLDEDTADMTLALILAGHAE